MNDDSKARLEAMLQDDFHRAGDEVGQAKADLDNAQQRLDELLDNGEPLKAPLPSVGGQTQDIER